MAKWTSNQCDSGILRKREFREKKEELFVFGYTCKLFRDNERAQHIDQGKHLIPWMGDETLKIDRYDARGALHDLSSLEVPAGGYDWRVELTKTELDVEQMCDEERYRALHTDEDEEEMYREEELKRLHAAGYGQVGFNYETAPEDTPVAATTEVDEPFEPTPEFKALFPSDIVMPESQKLNAIIEKTAKFIASQGIQMEILLRAKQADNPQFQFLNKDAPLHKYYTLLIDLVKNNKWPPKKQEEAVDDKLPDEDYLHPSLAATIIESAPSIPSIHYKPSADCDYTMLISKMKGEVVMEEEPYVEPLAPGELPPPGTEPTRLPQQPHIARAPVMYTQHPADTNQHSQEYYQQYAAYYQQYMMQPPATPAQPAKPVTTSAPAKSTGLSLMKNYNTDSDSDSDSEDSSSMNDKEAHVLTPPQDIQILIEKMASYVARNGDEFANIVRSKNDPRFTFLEPNHMYYPYFQKLMQSKRSDNDRGIEGHVNKETNGEKNLAPVSFSIKKMKEPDPVLPKPALPYESSSDDDNENKQANDKTESQQPQQVPDFQKFVHPSSTMLSAHVPPVVMYKIEAQEKIVSNNHNWKDNVTEKPKEINLKPVTQTHAVQDPGILNQKSLSKRINVDKPKLHETEPVDRVRTEITPPLTTETRKEKMEPREGKDDHYYKKEKKKHKEKKKDYSSRSRSSSQSKEGKKSRVSPESKSLDRRSSRRKEKDYADKSRDKRKKIKDDLESEIISIEENDEEFIDLTGDIIETKVEAVDSVVEKSKQVERRRRAAAFLKQVGVDPAAACLSTNSLASAMVDTLETLKKKKEEEERRRHREKRRHRDKYDRAYSDDDDRSHKKSKRRRRSHDGDNDDYESSKRKRRRKEKKHHTSKSKKKKAKQEDTKQLNIDLTSTLKELRSSSPTSALSLPEVEIHSQPQSLDRASSSSEEEGDTGKRKSKKKKTDREYSEGEWSSDSVGDSKSSSQVDSD